MMNRAARMSPICLAVVLFVLPTTTASAANDALSAQYQVSFAGTSTQHDFEGWSGPQTATVMALGIGGKDGW